MTTIVEALRTTAKRNGAITFTGEESAKILRLVEAAKRITRSSEDDGYLAAADVNYCELVEVDLPAIEDALEEMEKP